ncbi:DUF3039 domain-containing protein [[Mycobacterium] burgundiense]|uniref:DUF3039 domain-containing protein n=1 Tax=[Mycobacterium] burgundiense TaxID=3064286 RepID=A0ABN9NJF3_9MYCO|nr:DUF3039 domain-containing protein [Mycolicibacterium sp. MU0053]CAJ1505572.1 DUF3039 domain-containing protein [Mycolicibacterium sp. MU0053]
MHSRRARPTIRVLTEDIPDGWSSPHPRRMLETGDYYALHPLSELPHPIIAKAAEAFGMVAEQDNPVGPIASSTQVRLMEIKIGQWRGGVWRDPETCVHWLVVAGLAKGDHNDHDDFYVRVEADNSGDAPQRWMPTEIDVRLLKRETASRLITEWELLVQVQVLKALRTVHAGGTARFTADHPVPGKGRLATVTITVNPVREPDYEADEIVVDIDPVPEFAGQHLLWQLTIRVLTALNPPHEGWDRYGNTYSNIVEVGGWGARAAELDAYVLRHELVESEPGQHCHYAHRDHIAGSTVEGSSVRALCGAYFVSCRDHTDMPVCPDCERLYSALPK